jgi:aminoglycoside 6'-N-acetyltransferase I
VDAEVAVRELDPARAEDLALWAAHAHALWPEAAVEAHRAEIAATAGPGVGGRRGFVAEEAGAPVGFAELGLRPYANGCATRPVAFLEGVWVAQGARRTGAGRALVAHVEAVARAEGLREIASDALVANRVSQAAHRAWGFDEVDRVVCFRKAL